MTYKNREIINLTDMQLKQIEKCTFLDECPAFIRPSKMSEKVKFITTSDKLGRYSVAKEDISSGEVIVELDGTLTNKPFRWTLQIDANVHVTGPGGINHHCTTTNLSVDLDKMAIIAEKDIQEGEELTINYLSFEKDMLEPFECICDSKEEECYGTIRGFDYLNSSQKDRLRNQFNILPHLN